MEELARPLADIAEDGVRIVNASQRWYERGATLRA